MKQEYVILQKSENSYKRCKALINIIKRDFGKEIIYMCTPIEKAKEEILKCFNNIFKYISWLNDILQMNRGTIMTMLVKEAIGRDVR